LKELELVILGAGPGGLAAAVEAARAGVSVTLLDENPKPGGQIFRQFRDGFQVTNPSMLGHDFVRGHQLLSEFDRVRDRVEILDNSVVWLCPRETSLPSIAEMILTAFGTRRWSSLQGL